MNGVKQEEISAILKELADHIVLDKKTTREFAVRLCKVYSDEKFRHSYYEISRTLEILGPDQRDILSEHIQNLWAEVSDNGSELIGDEQKKENVLDKISKLQDHVDLEGLRLARIGRVEHIEKAAHSELLEAEGKLKETSEKAAELGKRITNYQEQSIAILGIFAGLVITFSGVIQFASASLGQFADASAMKITFFVCLSMFFLFNIVFLLLYCIAKIAGSSIATNCRKRNCEDCKNCSSIFCRIRRKYPYVFYFDIAGAVFCGILCWLCK